MSCGRDARGEMLSMSLFLTAINQALINFCKGQSHADLWIRVSGAIEFLSYYPERSPKQRKRSGLDLPKFGFRGDKRTLSYEQLVVAQRYLKEETKRLIQTKKALPRILYLQFDMEKRIAAARYCIELFHGLCGRYSHCFRHPI